jgi:hypothetical protein
MSTPFAERPSFFEGQYLGAEDLQALLSYCSEQLRRHQLGPHTWGIVAGLDIVYPEQADGSVQAFLTPGVAVDGFARMVVVPAAQAVDAGLFTGQPAGDVPLWLRYDEAPAGGLRAGFETCGRTDAYQRVLEGYALGAGEKGVAQRQSPVWVGDDSFSDARAAPGAALPGAPIAIDGSVAMQAFPGPGDPSRWWIPLGTLAWTGAGVGAATADSRKVSRLRRRIAGWSGEALLGANGLLRLRPRLQSGDADTLETLATPLPGDLVYAKADAARASPVPREPIWLEADVRARGHVRHYGTRTEWVDPAGTDYLANGKVTALRRQAQGSAKGLELQVLLGPAAGGAGPTRLAIGASTVRGDDPVQLDFDFQAGAVVQSDGKVGIGLTDLPLALPLTVRADGGQSGLVAFHKQNGTIAWQVNLGPAEKGLNFTQADPKATNLYLAASGEVGIGTDIPEAKFDIRAVSSSNPSELAQHKWFQVGNGADPDQGRVWLQYGPALAPLLVMSDLDDPSRVQFQQTGTGSEAKPERASWIGLARGASADLALFASAVGVNTTEPKRPLHVEGGEIHSGGAGAGHSFANRGSAWADVPAAGTGDRWVLYARGGVARLWSGGDLLGLTPAGNLGVGTTAPAARIDAVGSILLGAGPTRYFAVGGLNDARIIAGRCAIGSMSGTGWTATNTSTGRYQVNFTGAFTAPPVVSVTPERRGAANQDRLATLEFVTAAGFSVTFKDMAPGAENTFQDSDFHFMAYGRRD